MKHRAKLSIALSAMAGFIAFTIYATPLVYDPPQPQTGDSELVISHKTAVNISVIADWARRAAPTATPTATFTPTPTPTP
jgi:hypothetical protein